MSLFTRRRPSLGAPARPAAAVAPPDLHAAYAPPATPPTAPPPADAAEPTEVRIVAVEPTVGGPTWELELLVSGALTFALLQAPAAIDRGFDVLARDAAGVALALIVVVRFYLGAIVWALVAALVLNLTARAYWVGLVGLRTVFPDGPRWDRWRGGPHLRAAYQRRGTSLPRLIARVDRFASVTFSFGFLVVLLAVVSAVTLGAAYPVGWLVARAVGKPDLAGGFWLIAWALLLLGRGLLRGVDRVLGPRLRPGRLPSRVLGALMRAVAATNGSALVNPIRATLLTHLPRGVRPLLAGALALTMGAGVVEVMARSGQFEGRSLTYLPEAADVRGRHAVHYESLGGAEGLNQQITIQSDIITDPYLRLFVPYPAQRAADAVPRLCPGTPKLRTALVASKGRGGDARSRADAERAIACLTRIHWVRLDGRPLVGLRWHFTTHRTDGRAGIITYVPVQGLAAGEHRLVVAEMPHVSGGEKAKVEQDSSEIPFWK